VTDPLPRLRAICLAQAGASERLSHGEPTWFVRGRVFATYADHHHDDRVAFWAAAPGEAAATLIAAAPDRFFRPPYYGVRGWIGVYLDVPVDWDEAAAIVEEAHRLIAAPRR
jgi:predicted DNA-binding protein (MmcQ/YjbR family)